MHLLYLNGDKTLHDCGDMDDRNVHFSDIIKVRRAHTLSRCMFDLGESFPGLPELQTIEKKSVYVIRVEHLE